MFKRLIAFLKVFIFLLREFIFYISNATAVYSKYKIFLLPSQQIDSIENISLAVNFSMGKNCKLLARAIDASISIEENVKLNHNVMINADFGGKITISENVIIGPNTVFRASDHKVSPDKLYTKSGHVAGEIYISNNVWIGSNVVITKDIKIGENSIVGAGSVVTKNVEANTIVAGVPAKNIGTLPLK